MLSAAGRIFIVGPSHSFEQFAEAIDVAFARWDFSHLHSLELADGRVIGYPDDSFAPELIWLDHAKLKVAREVNPGEQFEYVFDLGDNWRRRCTVLVKKADPVEEYGPIPDRPAPIWGRDRSPISTAARASTATRSDQSGGELAPADDRAAQQHEGQVQPGSRS